MPNLTIYKDKKRETWYVQFTVDNKRVRKSLNTKFKNVALKRIDEMRKRMLDGENVGLCPKMTFDKFWEVYYSCAKVTKRPKTLDNDRRIWKAFTKWLRDSGIIHINRITSGKFEKYRAHLLERGLKKTSVNLIHRHLSSMFTFAVREGFMEFNPLKKVKKFKIDETKIEFLETEEIKKVMEEAEKAGERPHLIFGLGIYAGLRKSEIANTMWEWFDFRRNILTVQACGDFVPKSHKSREIPINLKLREILLRYQKEEGYLLNEGQSRKPKDEALNLIRTNFRNGFMSVVKRAGIEKNVTPHMLRHTFASQLAIAGVSLYKIQQWLGHSDPRTTMIYAHLQAQDDEINKI